MCFAMFCYVDHEKDQVLGGLQLSRIEMQRRSSKVANLSSPSDSLLLNRDYLPPSKPSKTYQNIAKSSRSPSKT